MLTKIMHMSNMLANDPLVEGSLIQKAWYKCSLHQPGSQTKDVACCNSCHPDTVIQDAVARNMPTSIYVLSVETLGPSCVITGLQKVSIGWKTPGNLPLAAV
jgi:hypothetical protein